MGAVDDAVDVAEVEGVLAGELEETGDEAEDEADAVPGRHSEEQSDECRLDIWAILEYLRE